MLLAAASADRLTAQAQLDLDRTVFGSIYGSGRFFRFLGQHVVNDHVHLHVKLQATRLPGARNMLGDFGQEIQGLEHLEVAGGPGQQFVIPRFGEVRVGLSPAGPNQDW